MSDRKPRILVVDDDSALQQLMRTLLERADMEPIQAMNAYEANEILSEGDLPDLVVLDLMLPDVSGMEYLQELRATEGYEHLPVIILSALADPDVISEGYDTGADRYLTKPYIAQNLIKTIHEMIGPDDA